MLVRNPEKHILAIPLHSILEDSEIGSDLLNNEGSVISLNEGWNEILPDDYKLCYKTVERLENKGLLECKRVKFKDSDTEQEVAIYDVRADQARKIVEDCWDIKTLERWANDSKNTAELRTLSDMQLEKIDGYTPPKRV